MLANLDSKLIELLNQMMEQTNGLRRDCRLRTGDGVDLIIPRFLLEASSLFFASLFRFGLANISRIYKSNL
jgi:hypothetical protein